MHLSNVGYAVISHVHLIVVARLENVLRLVVIRLRITVSVRSTSGSHQWSSASLSLVCVVETCTSRESQEYTLLNALQCPSLNLLSPLRFSRTSRHPLLTGSYSSSRTNPKNCPNSSLVRGAGSAPLLMRASSGTILRHLIVAEECFGYG